MLQLRSSDAILSRPHASHRQGGRDQEINSNGLTAHEHVQEVKSPRTECLSEFELNYAPRIINHSQMQFNYHTQRKITAFRHAFIQHVHFIFIISK